VRGWLVALTLLAACAAVSACGEDPCPPFLKDVCGDCGEKSAACTDLRATLDRAREENRDLDALCERGHDLYKSVDGDRCRTTPF